MSCIARMEAQKYVTKTRYAHIIISVELFNFNSKHSTVQHFYTAKTIKLHTRRKPQPKMKQTGSDHS